MTSTISQKLIGKKPTSPPILLGSMTIPIKNCQADGLMGRYNVDCIILNVFIQGESVHLLLAP